MVPVFVMGPKVQLALCQKHKRNQLVQGAKNTQNTQKP